MNPAAFAGTIWSRNFFTDHYDHPIYECGVQLVDMVYLQREL